MAVCCASASEVVGALARVIGAVAKPIEQARVLDGNNRLVCESGDKLNLVLGERLNLQLPQDQNANKIVLRNIGTSWSSECG